MGLFGQATMAENEEEAIDQVLQQCYDLDDATISASDRIADLAPELVGHFTVLEEHFYAFIYARDKTSKELWTNVESIDW